MFLGILESRNRVAELFSGTALLMAICPCTRLSDFFDFECFTVVCG